MKNRIKKTVDFITNLLFPCFCIGCQKEGIWLCPDCNNKIILVRTPACLICNRLDPHGLCPAHRRNFLFNTIYSAGYYSDPILKSLIHTFKYDGAKDLAVPLGNILLSAIKDKTIPKNTIIAPIPLSYQRYCERGFNQSELLAQYISQHTKIPLIKPLRRQVHTKPQADLKRRERLHNVQNAFSIMKHQLVKDKNIILVDDVVTTGSTASECAKILKQNGAKKIIVLTLAHG